MDDIGSAIQDFLAQPGAMEQVEAMAKQLGLGGGGDAAPSAPEAVVSEALPALSGLSEGLALPEGISPELLGTLAGALQGGTSQASTALFEALRPLLAPQKHEKLDRAIKAVRLASAAKTVTKTLGALEPHG